MHHNNLNLVTFLVLMCSTVGVFSIECGDSSWTPFKDGLCIKLLDDQLVNFFSAVDICGGQAERHYNPSLLRIDSQDIQDFVQSHLYTEHDVVDDVWIGARFNEDKNDFVWLNGSNLEYTNWAPGYPRNVTDVERCVVIRPPGSKVHYYDTTEADATTEAYATTEADVVDDAKWFDVSCYTHKIVACQREPVWSNEKIVAQLVKLTEQINSCNCQPSP